MLYKFLLLILIFASGTMLGCNDYWWQRGQPASTKKQLMNSQQKFELSLQTYKDARPQVSPIFQEIEKSLSASVVAIEKNQASQNINSHLKEIRSGFFKLEGLLSVGSRAAFGELSGQLRAFIEQSEQGHSPDRAVFGLYAARILSFLANELSVPAPS